MHGDRSRVRHILSVMHSPVGGFWQVATAAAAQSERDWINTRWESSKVQFNFERKRRKGTKGKRSIKTGVAWHVVDTYHSDKTLLRLRLVGTYLLSLQGLIQRPSARFLRTSSSRTSYPGFSGKLHWPEKTVADRGRCARIARTTLEIIFFRKLKSNFVDDRSPALVNSLT